MITGNIIIENTASDGGGICCLWASPTITHNIISKNTASKLGGGIKCYMGSNPLIAYNTITENLVTGDNSDGGGIEIYKSSPVIANNTISNNSSPGSACRGGGICCFWDSYPTIFGNIIAGNSASWAGGGIYMWRTESASVKVCNNTFFKNTAKEGGGFYCGWSVPNIANSIFWENSASYGKEIWIGNAYYPSTLSISYCDVKGGKASVYVGSGSTLHWGAGMIDADPLFVDPGVDDFHLTYPSPCRNVGDNSAVLDPFDFEEDPRVAQEIVDLGGDEFHAHLYYTGEATPSGNIETKLVGPPGTWPVGLFLGSGVLDPPLPTQWGDFHLESPWHMYVLWPLPSKGVLILPATLPSSPPAPYELPLQALMGDAWTNLCRVSVH